MAVTIPILMAMLRQREEEERRRRQTNYIAPRPAESTPTYTTLGIVYVENQDPK